MALPDDQKEQRLEDLEWPDEGGSGGDGEGTDAAEGGAKEEAPAATNEWSERTTRTVNPDGSVDVDITGITFDKPDTSFDPGDTDRDSDRDGLTDAFEKDHGTDPFNADTDGDGSSDATETEWGWGTATIWSPPTATADDVDGDGLSNLREQYLGGSWSVDAHAAAGLGSDLTELPRKYYETHKTDDNPIGNAALRKELGIEATPEEQEELDREIGDAIFSDNPLVRVRGEVALADFDNDKVPTKVFADAEQYVQDRTNAGVNDALQTNDPTKIIGVMRQDALGVVPLTDLQRQALGDALNAISDGTTQAGVPVPGLTLPPPGVTGTGFGGGGTGTGGGTGDGTGSGTGTAPAPAGGTSGTGSGTGTSPGAGFGDPSDRRIPIDTQPTEPTGPDPAGTTPAAPTPPAWQDAADNLGKGEVVSEPSGVGGMGSRGDGGGSSLPGSIGPLGGTPTQPGSSTTGSTTTGTEGPKTGGSAGGPEATDGSGAAIPIMSKDGNSIDHFERTNADGSTTIMTADGDEVFTIPPSKEGKDASSEAGGDTNSDAGTTDDDGENEPDDGSEEGGSLPPDDGNSEEATAYVDPDVVFAENIDTHLTGLDYLQPVGGAVVDIRYTNTGNPDSGPPIDLTGVTPEDTVAPTDTPQPDAGDPMVFDTHLGGLDYLEQMDGVVIDIRYTNTGNPDTIGGLPDTSDFDPSTLGPDGTDAMPGDDIGFVGDDGSGLPFP